jgi:hypothetical protein
MVSPEALDHFGSTEHRLRAVFSRCEGEDKLNSHGQKLLDDRIKAREAAQRGDMAFPDVEDESFKLSEKDKKEMRKSLLKDLDRWNKYWKDRIRPRLESGRLFGLKNHRFYMAGDLAWNNPPITDASVPIMAWVQRKISLDTCVAEVKKLCKDSHHEYFLRDDEGKVIGVNHERITDIQINLCRPYIRRSVATQANAYNDLHPFLKYDSRIKSLIGQLRADLVSERVEIMADQFGYRRLNTQMVRRMFLHGSSVAFVSSEWEREYGYQSQDGKLTEVVEREGVSFDVPHPTRIFYDQSAALPELNFDRGPSYVGYWDCVRYAEVKNNPGFFNTKAIPYSSQNNLFSDYSSYFNYYYSKAIKAPQSTEAMGNQRTTASEIYGEDDDESIWVSHYYDRIIPREHGLGDYPHPVWLHLIIASDDTVVFAQFLPSRPCFVYSYDEDDGQLLSISKALDILPYQEQVQSLYSQITYLMRLSSMLIMMVDTDIIDKTVVKALDEAVRGKQLMAQTHLIKWSSQIKELLGEGMATKKPIEVFQAQLSQNINELMKVIGSIIAMLEKNQMMGPNEMAQFNQRETSASESMIVDKSSNALSSFKSEGVDEGRQAQKIICYESMIVHGSKNVHLSIPERYQPEVIEAAGFQLEPMPDGYEVEDPNMTVIGTTQHLIHAYTFTSRDGSERHVSIESAKLIMELVRYIFTNELALQSFLKMFGPEQIAKAISEIFRLSGAAMTLKLPATFSEKSLEDQLASPEFKEELKAAMSELAQRMGQQDQRLGEVENVAQHYVSQQEAMAPPPEAMAPAQ